MKYDENKTPAIYGGIVTALGCLMLGHWLPTSPLVAIGDSPTIKPVSAICCIIGGLILSLLAHKDRSAKIDIWASCLSFFIAAVMCLYVGNHGPLLNATELQISPLSVGLNTPSLGTIVGFIAFAFGGFASASRRTPRWKTTCPAIITGSIGAFAMLGYILQQPKMYYFFESISSGMAPQTAVMLILLSIGLISTASTHTISGEAKEEDSLVPAL